MGGLFGGSPDTSAADEQAAALAKQERAQAAELSSRRRAAGSGTQSKTLFSAVLGTDEAIGKKTTLGS